MMETELNELESQIDALIEQYQKAKLENGSLQRKVRNLNNETIALLDKKQKTAESLKNLIQQLQDKLLCPLQK